MKKYRSIILIPFIFAVFSFLFLGGEKNKMASVEDLDIYVGAGIGINKQGEGIITYRISTASNMFKENEVIEKVIHIGRGSTVGKTREDRQSKTGKQFFLGLTKIYLLDEEFAKHGIRNWIDAIFKNPIVNDKAYIVVCNGKNEEYFNYNAPGYENSSEYMSDMVKNSKSFNFFDDDYMVKNAILSIDAEGKNMVCPYIELKEDGIKITGIAVFKKDKIGAILDMQDTKIMNMLRENKVKGMLTIQKDSKEYINFLGEAKRKIKCKKEGDKYHFTIDLNIVGDVLNNELYKHIGENKEEIDKFEKDMEKKVEAMCNDFIKKMKDKYKTDCLQLGFIAASKYGRGTGVDWDKIICESSIEVKVKVKVDKVGRGEY